MDNIPLWARQAYNDWQSAIESTRRFQQIYNDWLSKLDQIQKISPLDTTVPVLQKLQKDLNELFQTDAQKEFNARTVHLVNELLDYLRASTAQLSHLLGLQMEYFRQITPWMDAKIHELRAEENHNVTFHVGDLIQKLNDLKLQIASVERQIRKGSSPSIATTQTTESPKVEKDFRYHTFEQIFRESSDRLKESLRRYLPMFADSPEPIVDLGCGRGEFLSLIQETGKSVYGIDFSELEIGRLKDAGYQAVSGDIQEYVRKLDPESIGGVFCAQVVEHLTPDSVYSILADAHRAMKPGSPIVIETVNPLSVFAYHHLFFKDPTHVFPVHPDTLAFMLRYTGFQDVQIHWITPVPEQEKIPEPRKEDFSPAGYEYVKALGTRLNQLLYDSLEYYAVGIRR